MAANEANGDPLMPGPVPGRGQGGGDDDEDMPELDVASEESSVGSEVEDQDMDDDRQDDINPVQRHLVLAQIEEMMALEAFGADNDEDEDDEYEGRVVHVVPPDPDAGEDMEE